MRNIINLNQGWRFTGPDGTAGTVDVPHTWNNIDGQDGGNDYKRCVCTYERTFPAPDFDRGRELVYLQFHGVNSSCQVTLNGHIVCSHDGGYSTFRAEVTGLLRQENQLVVSVDNRVNDTVYPQKADFTFYGGIYRDVELLVVASSHFDLDYFGGPGLKVTPTVNGRDGKVRVESFPVGEYDRVSVVLSDALGSPVAQGEGTDVTLTVPASTCGTACGTPISTPPLSPCIAPGRPWTRSPAAPASVPSP